LIWGVKRGEDEAPARAGKAQPSRP